MLNNITNKIENLNRHFDYSNRTCQDDNILV